MSTVGGVLETKDIGLPISLGGTHNNTEIDSTTGFLRLKAVDLDATGKNIYAEEGSWTSSIIDLEDKFADFGKVFTTDKVGFGSSIAVLTRVSDDKNDWSDWKAVAMDGTIQSGKKQYIQIRIDFFAGFETDVYLISEFNNADDVNLFDNNSFIETSNGLRLKRNYEFNMELNNSWTGEGSLHTKRVTRAEWLRIDKMNVISKEVI